jgi:hypothetical protein
VLKEIENLFEGIKYPPLLIYFPPHLRNDLPQGDISPKKRVNISRPRDIKEYSLRSGNIFSEEINDIFN